MNLKRAHQIVGLTFIIIFLLTGQYMEFGNPVVREMEDGARMMFRSRHIYILLAGLVNVGVGAYFQTRAGRWQRALQLTGSILIIAGPLLLLAAFFYEPALPGMQRTFTLPALITLLAGALLHLISGAGKASTEPHTPRRVERAH